MKKDKNNYKYIGITHASETNKVKNVPLEKNPNKKDNSKSYARPNPSISNKKNFNKGKENYKLRSKKDRKTMKDISKKKTKKEVHHR